MLLSNLTASSGACSVLLTLKIPVIPLPNNILYPTESRCGSCPAPVPYPQGEPQQVMALPLLVDAFVDGATVGDSEDLSKRKRKGELHFLASVFGNMSMVRNFILFHYHILILHSFSHLRAAIFFFLRNLPTSSNPKPI